MLPFFNEIYGNPANGLHVLGRKAARAMEIAREQVAELIGASPSEIVFTSGATESNHLAILGTAEYAPPERRKVITCAIEHKAVLTPCHRLAERGFEVIVLPVDSNGLVPLIDLEKALGSDTFLVSIQAANNEIGTIQPIAEIVKLAHQRGALVHTDAAQAVGKIMCDVSTWGIDFLSLSAHKLYGPKGIGTLYVRGGVKTIPIRPLLEGGGQENGLRAGTSNVPAIVGFGEASHICHNGLEEELPKIRGLRDDLEKRLLSSIPSLRINGSKAERLPNTSSLTIPNIEADAMILNTPQIMVGTGSACSTGAIEPSHVLTAIGLSREEASRTMRISFGRFVQPGQVETISKAIITSWRKLLPA
jgi:cysteine desulfurase